MWNSLIRIGRSLLLQWWGIEPRNQWNFFWHMKTRTKLLLIRSFPKNRGSVQNRDFYQSWLIPLDFDAVRTIIQKSKWEVQSRGLCNVRFQRDAFLIRFFNFSRNFLVVLWGIRNAIHDRSGVMGQGRRSCFLYARSLNLSRISTQATSKPTTTTRRACIIMTRATPDMLSPRRVSLEYEKAFLHFSITFWHTKSAHEINHDSNNTHTSTPVLQLRFITDNVSRIIRGAYTTLLLKLL